MSSIKSKKKTKTALIPKPIKIKKEDDHIIYPMEHYVDDRVELIRQIFSSLKPKTITNLAPDFLKKSKLEDIQEQCLNEVLGISKKRLLSIINSTKCPTDTDTSGEEDEHIIEEHISLEEISSDSDIADQKVAKGPKDKQFSVLELLELQARARAIRSQLALEPVTKIEVDTDSDEEKPQPKSKSGADPASRKKPTNVSNGGSSSSKTDPLKRSATISRTVSNSNTEPTQNSQIKRIKLKRNFRKHVQNDESNDDEKLNETTIKPAPQAEPKKEMRSPSPDVIPIISVPETLCISDSDDEQSSKKKPSKEVEATKVTEPVKPIEILSVVEISAANNFLPVDQKDIPKEAEEEVPIEHEEGEIFDDDEKTQDSSVPESSKSNINDDVVEQLNQEVSEEIECKEELKNKDKEDEKKVTIDCDEPQRVDKSDSDDDSNDDVISLEGGDLLNEMKEHLVDEPEEPSKSAKSEDIICLDDSTDEEIKPKKKTESWNERWLKSSKVSKVLAASRLGNRVRNKIKESKKAKKLEEAAENELEQKKAQEYVFTSRHEDGSVEQYKEIQDSIQRKAD